MGEQISGKLAADILLDVFGRPEVLREKAAEHPLLHYYHRGEAAVLEALQKVVSAYDQQTATMVAVSSLLPDDSLLQLPLSREELEAHGGEQPSPPPEER